MRRLIFALAVASLALGVQACEVITDSTDIPYTEHIVVHATAIAGQPIARITFDRSLPVSEPYVSENAWLKDVAASITVDGVAHPLRWTGENDYELDQPLVAEVGKTYLLQADWHSKHISATTTVPAPPVVDSIRIRPFSDIYRYDQGMNVYVRARSMGVYSYDYSVDSTAPTYARYPEDVVRSRHDSTVVLTNSTGYYWNDLTQVDSVFVRVTSYDSWYYDFLNTYRNNDGDGGFASGGLQPAFNVHGDGIGIFIGLSTVGRWFPTK